MTEMLRHRSFTKKKKLEPVTFELDGDMFYCVAKMPMNLTRKISELKDISEDNVTERFNVFVNVLDDLLHDDSLTLFKQRLGDKTKPIDLDEVAEIIEWLIEVYTQRPLEQSKESAPGSTISSIVNVGTSSTDGAQAEMLIQHDSPSTVF